ncbi:MAG: exodeoxyribonuclease VII small subunit [Oscillospiraceae bacterium]|nr:exodeoxyribonuclease VII small subunit [Oscillospiraceae bacterium]
MAEKKETKKLSFEQAMLRLEEIVKLLERGEAPIEKSLELFEEGAALMKVCAGILDKAEMKVKKLTEADEEEPVFSLFEEEQ